MPHNNVNILGAHCYTLTHSIRHRRRKEIRAGFGGVSRQSISLARRQIKQPKIDHITAFKMPRVVPDQRSKFENEEFFRKLSRECEASLLISFFSLSGGNEVPIHVCVNCWNLSFCSTNSFSISEFKVLSP